MKREVNQAVKGRTIRAIDDNLEEGDVIVCAPQMFSFFESRLRDYFLRQQPCHSNENSD